eukprot:COSAG04_NODE_32952_length_189_cov_24.066667_1_plen_56_part_10
MRMGVQADEARGRPAAENEEALGRAAYNGHSGVVRRLLELGADHTAVGTGGDYEGK